MNRAHGVTSPLLSSVVCFLIKDSRGIGIAALLRNDQLLKEKSVLTEKKSKLSTFVPGREGVLLNQREKRCCSITVGHRLRGWEGREGKGHGGVAAAKGCAG